MIEVAHEAGVSPATVSRVLTGSAHVAAGTRRQVHAAISRIGYLPRGSRPGDVRHGPVITAVMCEPTLRVFNDPFFVRLIGGAERFLAERGGALPLMSAASPALAVTEKHLLSGGTGGVLLASVRGRHPLALTLAATRLPVRCAGRPPEDMGVPFVDVDNQEGARRAVELLLRTRATVAHISGPLALTAAHDRLNGYLDAVTAAGRQPLVVPGDFTPRGGGHAMRVLLDRSPRLDAVFVASDPMAFGALSVLRQAGRTVPGDVAVIGFDDVPQAAHSELPLTTVRQPVEELGALAAQLLYEQVMTGTGPAPDQILHTTIIERATT